eukprot:TRINITY_DN4246_c0_g1_i1.p1 TRINITY_DN4246_c0_g1~~TRINITY_DN4246_c0_g1_i1.p1  ORF type:complete len:1038 (+),score=251.97 TRINITY_DN4246_c0_g1_i1:61-3174(+)
MDSTSSPPEGVQEGDGEPVTAENSNVTNGAVTKDGTDDTPTSSITNTMFIELHYATRVPTQWCHPDSGESPDYPENVFGWELDIMYPPKNDTNKETEEETEQDKQPPQNIIHTFTGGRLHDITPSLIDIICNDVPPNMKATSERADTATDVPGPSVVSNKSKPTSNGLDPTSPSTSQEESVNAGTQSVVDPPESQGGTSHSVPPEQGTEVSEAPSAGVVKTQNEECELGVVWSLGADAQPDDAPQSNDVNTNNNNNNNNNNSNGTNPPHTAKIPLSEQDLDNIQRAVDGAPLHFQLRRVLRASKASPDWEDVNEPRYRVFGTIPMTGFSEPGVDSITQNDIIVRMPVDDPSKEDKKGKKAPKKPVKGSAPAPAFLTTEEEFEQHPYEKCGTRIRIKIGFEKAIVCLPSERPRPGLVPADVIPKRVRQIKKQPDASLLLGDEVKDIVSSVVSDYRKFSPCDKSVDEATNRANFLRYLNTSGRSFAHRQKIKHCIIKIVKEKFSKRQGATAAEMEPFYNELYIYLLDQIHYSLNSMFSRDELQVPAYRSDEGHVDKWLRLATEAEIVQEYEIAERYHQERLVHGDPSSGNVDELPTVWVDFAKYYLRMRDAVKAEQALKEAIAIDFTHIPSLVAYGLLLLCRKREKEAEVFLQAAVDVDLKSPVPWACLSLYYERLLLSPAESEELHPTFARWAKYTQQQALRALDGETVTRTEDEPTPAGGVVTGAVEMYKLIVDLTLSLSLEVLTGHALNAIRNIQGGTLTAEYLLKEAKMYIQLKQFDKMRACATELLQDKSITAAQKTEGHLLLGEAYSDMGSTEVVIGEKKSPAAVLAEEHFDQALRIDESLVEGSHLFKLGNIYYSLGRYENAKDSFISASKKWPTSITWMGVGIASYRSGNYDHAEQALNESNVLNNLNGKTWAFISLVCLKQSPGREEEADQAFHQALKLGLKDASILSEIGVEQFNLGRLKLSEAALTQSLSQSDLPLTHLLLARTLTSLRRFEEARHHYTIVKQTSNRESELVKATQELEQLAGLEDCA